MGPRDHMMATEFMQNLVSQLARRVQLTTDGRSMYVNAFEDAFGADVDFAMLQKIYGPAAGTQARYSPPKCVGAITQVVNGKPRARTYLHVQRRTPKSHDADEHAPLHTTD